MTSPAYRPPSELADRIRERFRVEHARCGDNVEPSARSCFLGLLHAEDIQEILDAAREAWTRDKLAMGVSRPASMGARVEVDGDGTTRMYDVNGDETTPGHP